MLTIGVIGIVGVILAVWFKTIKPEYGIMISVVVCIFIFGYSLLRISDIIEIVDRLSGMTSISKILLKITGITFVSEISSDIAKDCGYLAVANQVQIFGKLTVLVVSLPVFTELIYAVTSLLT